MSNTRHINDGPSAADIFMAALHATNPKWETPLEFNIAGHLVTFTWINGPTWLGERSKYLMLTVMYEGIMYRIEYDTKMRMGEITPRKVGDPDIVSLHEQHKRKVIARVTSRL